MKHTGEEGCLLLRQIKETGNKQEHKQSIPR